MFLSGFIQTTPSQFNMGSLNDCTGASIIDIRRDSVGVSIVDEMRKTLNAGKGREKRLPTLLLYDEQGLKLFEEITYLEEYYLTNAEIGVLENHAAEMVQHVKTGSLIVELGSGYASKTESSLL